MKEWKPIGTPLEVNLNLMKHTYEEFAKVEDEIKDFLYKTVVGSLIYAIIDTRMELAYAMSIAARTISLSAQFSSFLCPEAVCSATYLLNRCAFYSHKPSVSHLCILGYTAYMHISSLFHYKLQIKSIPTIFVDYDNNSKAYKCYDRLGTCPITWIRKRQSTVSDNSTESEYKALNY
uniref:Retroviral polymerase SH3-like domain-containing protein n=1 Tax=Physcomitrium patens TaxID=3218 RepID=A0A2K1JEK0_PHYPA|nr:hypothetical protein PHYPA_020219 [Physcomitrium patens]